MIYLNSLIDNNTVSFFFFRSKRNDRIWSQIRLNMKTSKNSYSQYASKKDDEKETYEKSPCNRLINVLSDSFSETVFLG